MTTDIVKGLPSTHGDHYQLHTNLIRHAARTYPELVVHELPRTSVGTLDKKTMWAQHADIYKAATR